MLKKSVFNFNDKMSLTLECYKCGSGSVIASLAPISRSKRLFSLIEKYKFVGGLS